MKLLGREKNVFLKLLDWRKKLEPKHLDCGKKSIDKIATLKRNALVG